MATITAGEQTATTDGLHFDVIDEDAASFEDYGRGIRMELKLFPGAVDHNAFAALMERPTKRAMVKPAYPEEVWRPVGYNGLPLNVKTDYLCELPDVIFQLLKENGQLNVEVTRNIQRQVNALMHPELAPWGPGQGPQ